MPIKVHMLSLGALQTNCFVVADEESKDAIIIDPSDEPQQIMKLVEEQSYNVRAIIATHGHFDHVLAAGELKAKTGAKFGIHELDVEYLKRSQQIAQTYGIPAPPPAEHDFLIEAGDEFELGAIKLETIFTPGHAPGHVSFVMANEKIVFSGDCLFQGSIGRTDLPGGDYDTLLTSIVDKLLPLGDDFQVCNGHGPITTIGFERQFNPFLREWFREHDE